MYRRRQDMTDEELEKWFYDQKQTTETGCWEWTRGMTTGYGMLRVDRKPILAHRFSLQLHLKRPIEKHVEVRHMCHNTKCFNPEHLKEGTHAQNMRDMVDANRQAKGEYLSQKCKGIVRDKIRGEGNGRVKLTIEQVNEILTNNTDTFRVIGNKYGISTVHVKRIKTGESWKHIPR